MARLVFDLVALLTLRLATRLIAALSGVIGGGLANAGPELSDEYLAGFALGLGFIGLDLGFSCGREA